MHADAAARSESDLIVVCEVSRVEHRDIQSIAEQPKGHGLAATRDLCGNDGDDLVGDSTKVFDRGRREAELLGQRAEEQLLAENVHLKQAGPETASDHALALERAGQLIEADPAASQEKLSEFRHGCRGIENRRVADRRASRGTASNSLKGHHLIANVE